VDEIRELVYVLNQNRIRIFGKSGTSDKEVSKMRQLYQALLSGKVADDAGALKLLYPGKTDDSAYRKLKSQFRDRLIEHLEEFDTHQSHFTDYQKAYYACNKQWMCVKILAGQNAHKAALFLAIKLLRKVNQYEFTLLAVDLLSYIMLQYSTTQNKSKEMRAVMQELAEKHATLEAETKSELIYANLMADLSMNKLNKVEVGKRCVLEYENLVPLLNQHRSYKLHLNATVIGFMRYSTVNDYASMLSFCLERVAFFEAKPFHARAAFQLLYYHELVCRIQFRQFEQGREVAQRCFDLSETGTYNWFKYQELFLQLCFYTENYQQASETIAMVVQHQRFHFLPEQNKEAWKLFEYYERCVSILSGRTQPDSSPFRYKKVRNELDYMSKDKGGMNIAIVILHLIFLLIEDKGDEVIEAADRTEQYCYRFLNNAESERSLYFIRMLLRLPLDVVMPSTDEEKKSFKMLQQLNNLQGHQNFTLEIVPYEKLWEMLLIFYQKYNL
jgi:hypothetical protein